MAPILFLVGVSLSETAATSAGTVEGRVVWRGEVGAGPASVLGRRRELRVGGPVREEERAWGGGEGGGEGG